SFDESLHIKNNNMGLMSFLPVQYNTLQLTQILHFPDLLQPSKTLNQPYP
ncbi:unnamed protein product, partial [Brassica rapa subsp. trilocularis]